MKTQATADTFARASDADLETCAREPIHLLGRIQSYGALIAVSSDWFVQHASENLAEILGPAAEDPIGRPLSEILPDEALRLVRARLRNIEIGAQATRIFGFPVHDRLFDVSVHQSGRHLILEFEPKAQTSDGDVLAQTYPLIQKVRGAYDIQDVAREGARALQALSGFDSVMVYKFESDGSGRVVAQSRIGRSPDYMGLRFPASDIPQQARELYKRSLLRLISDVSDPGAAIVPARAPEGTQLDLSLAVTRAVSPVHIEYLRNMGVEASMSVSILKDGELWGLFACHHRAPRYIEFETRTAIELFAHLFSYELTRLQERTRAERETRIRDVQSQLMRRMAEGRDLADSLWSVSGELNSVIPHDGIMLYTNGALARTGQTPSDEEFAGLARFLNTAASSRVYSTDTLPREHPPAADYASGTTGILAIPISRSPRDYLVFCRNEEAQNVTWAGKPEKHEVSGPDGTRLTPRTSFAAWQETVAGSAAPWTEETLAAADSLRALLLEIFLRLSDAANAERQRAQERQELLIAELNHRVRNILNLMRGLISQSRHEDMSVDRFASSLDGRIQSLARAHDQLTRKDWAPSSLTELLRFELAAYVDDVNRVSLAGEDVLVAPEAYTTLALVLHEMVTNSVKYGALSSPNGRLSVTLSRDAAGAVDVDWTESGGPSVQPPRRHGFGTAIIERSIPYELNGEADIHYRVSGVTARFRVPPRFLSEPENVVELQRVRREVPAERPRLTGAALVVEDAMIIAMDAADILKEFGAEDVQIAGSVREGLAALEKGDFEVAILDVNLGGEQSVAIAQELARRGTPFILATGYGEHEDLRATFPPCRILQKPFSNDSISEALRKSGVGR